MRLYEITYNGRKWETTNGDEAFAFCKKISGFKSAVYMDEKYWFGKLSLTITPYEGEEIPNIQVA